MSKRIALTGGFAKDFKLKIQNISFKILIYSKKKSLLRVTAVRPPFRQWRQNTPQPRIKRDSSPLY